MELQIQRKKFEPKFTIGRWSVDGEDLGCDSLEDTVRYGSKVYGETAIPAGRYQIIMSYSPRFKRDMPEIIRVPNYVGIRIHSFNESKDTDGCVAGGIHNPNYNGGDWIGNSRFWTAVIEAKIVDAINAGDGVWITIKD